MLQVAKNTSPSKPPKLLDQVRAAIRTKHYSLRTEEFYIYWIKRYIFFHQKRRPVTTYLLENDYDFRTIQELLDQNEDDITMIYTHVMNKGGMGVKSSVDLRSGRLALGLKPRSVAGETKNV